MKEVAITGLGGQVFADVLSALLHRGLSVNAFIKNPEHLMLNYENLTISRLEIDTKDALKDSFEGYHDVIFTFDDDQTDHDANSFVLDRYDEMVNAAREAGVNCLVVGGAPQAEAFFVGDLRRRNDIDWVFISTEGDYATRAADEVIAPHFHHEVYTE